MKDKVRVTVFEKYLLEQAEKDCDSMFSKEELNEMLDLIAEIKKIKGASSKKIEEIIKKVTAFEKKTEEKLRRTGAYRTVIENIMKREGLEDK